MGNAMYNFFISGGRDQKYYDEILKKIEIAPSDAYDFKDGVFAPTKTIEDAVCVSKRIVLCEWGD